MDPRDEGEKGSGQHDTPEHKQHSTYSLACVLVMLYEQQRQDLHGGREKIVIDVTLELFNTTMTIVIFIYYCIL